MEKKNLVMGAVRGYSFEQLKPFVQSLRAARFDGDICLLYDHLSPETMEALGSAGVRLVPLEYRGAGALNSWSRFWKWVKPVVRVLGRSGPGRKMMKMVTPLQTNRFYGYYDFLVKHRHEYSHVLLTDVRDVIFQADPFKGFHRTRVCCFEEDRAMSEDLVYNLPWVKILFGDRAPESFVHEKILCSGTILGPVGEMIDYLAELESALLQANDIGVGGSDQGLHNYVARTSWVDRVEVVPNVAGEVLTVYDANLASYPVRDGLFMNHNGQVMPVVHQYDRNKELESTLQKRLLGN